MTPHLNLRCPIKYSETGSSFRYIAVGIQKLLINCFLNRLFHLFSESIFGYRDLRVKLYYTAGCLETYLGMTYSEKINKAIYEGVEADEVLPKVVEKLAPDVHDNIDSFIKSLKKDDTFRPHGELLHSVSVNGNF